MSVPFAANPITYLTTACVVIPFLWSGIKAWYKSQRDNDRTRSFVFDMATNHLPHIYDALEKLCIKEGIAIEPTPPIQFMTFEEAEKRKNG